MNLRRDDQCAVCAMALPAGTSAYWFRSEKKVRCVDCHTPEASQQVAGEYRHEPVEVEQPVRPKPEEQDAAGGSAQYEYERRSERELAKRQQRIAEDAEWRASIKEKSPVLGHVVSFVTPKPQITPESQATTAWKVGAEGERRVAEVLAEATGVEVLHDRLVPGSKANIDHIAVGPAGVFVIDAKKYTGGIEIRDVGGFLRYDPRLYVNGRDRTKLVDGVLKQVEVVTAALGDEFVDVPVSGVLCFVGCNWGLVKKPKTVRSVTALWPKRLPEHVLVDGPFGERISPVRGRLKTELRAARPR